MMVKEWTLTTQSAERLVRGHVWLMCGQSCSDVRGNRNRQVYRDTCWDAWGHTRLRGRHTHSSQRSQRETDNHAHVFSLPLSDFQVLVPRAPGRRKSPKDGYRWSKSCTMPNSKFGGLQRIRATAARRDARQRGPTLNLRSNPEQKASHRPTPCCTR